MERIIAFALICVACLLLLQLESAQPSLEAQSEDAETAQHTKHVWEAGDSWWMLAHLTYRERGLSSEDIRSVNPDKKPAPGTVVLIPLGDERTNPAVEVQAPADAADVFHGVRLIRAKAGDTAYRLAVQYYRDRSRFRDIMNSNPSLNWADRLEGGEWVLLPATAPTPAADDSTQVRVIEAGDVEVEVTVKIRQRKK